MRSSGGLGSERGWESGGGKVGGGKVAAAGRAIPKPDRSVQVLLVDDHTTFRQALGFRLHLEPDLTVAGEAGTVAEARRALADARMHRGIDVALVDLVLPDGDGVDLVRLLATERMADARPTRAVVLTALDDRYRLALAVEAGAVGAIHKAAPLDEVLLAVRKAAAGEDLIAPREALELLRLARHWRETDSEAKAKIARLTRRECEVLQALQYGLSNREIARQLSVSHETARTHMSNLLAKLEVGSRSQALLFAIRHGIVKIQRW